MEGEKTDVRNAAEVEFASTGVLNDNVKNAADRLFVNTGGKNKHAKNAADQLFVSKTIVRKPLLKNIAATA